VRGSLRWLAVALVGLLCSVILVRPSVAQPGAPASEVAPEQAITQKIAVWRIDALGMEADLVEQLEALFRMELSRLASKPMPARRDLERQVPADLRDCTGEDKCLAAIGKKLGVEVMVTGSVGALGDNYILNIKAVDVASATQLRRITTDPLRGEPDELIESIRVAAYRLLAPSQLYGSVMVLSDLVGAEVKLDGKPAGRTPLPGPLPKLTLGTHDLEVTAAGYSAFREKVDVRFQKQTRVVVRLVTADGQDNAPVLVTRSRSPWYSRWYTIAGVVVGAAVVGALIGGQLGGPDIVDCSEDPSQC
jgi:hypothetical protein